MFFARTNKTARRHRGISLVSSLLFFFVLVLFSLPVRAESRTTSKENQVASENNFSTSDPDSTKQKYELNDPRNPDCPCHAAQKQAEDEYKRLQGQNGNQQNNSNANNVTTTTNNNSNNSKVATNKNNSSGTSSGTSKHYSKSKSNLKQMTKWMKKVKRKMRNKNNGTKKGKHRLVDCFHFQ